MNLIDTIHKRIKNNKNVLVVVTGETGSGKSSLCIRLGEVLDSEFGKALVRVKFTKDMIKSLTDDMLLQFPNIKEDKELELPKRIVFTPEDFLELLNKGIEDRTLHKGSVIIFDEAGVGIPAKEWYDISVRLFNYIMQTFRQDNLIVLFSTPSLDFIEKDSRKLLHFHIETVAIDYGEKEVISKVFRIQYNDRNKKTYYKYLKDVSGCNIKSTRTKMSSQDFFNRYEVKKRIYTNILNNDAEAVIRNRKSAKKKDTVNIRKIKDEVLEKLDFYGALMKNGKWRINKNLLLGHYDGLGRRRAETLKSVIESELNQKKKKRRKRGPPKTDGIDKSS